MNKIILITIIASIFSLQSTPKISSTDPIKLSEVRTWAYQLQKIDWEGSVDKLVSSKYDMLVIEPTRTDWSSDTKSFDIKSAVTKIKNSKAGNGINRKLAIAYIDIGEAEDWRWYWTWSTKWKKGTPRPTDWPSYILTHDPDGWDGNYPVAYWDSKWKDIMIYGKNQNSNPYGNYTSAIDEAIKDGFDGIYLDWVEAFEDTDVAKEAKRQGLNPEAEMVKFIKEMKDYAKKRNPNFLIIQQNASELYKNHPELFNYIDAIAQEAIWYDGSATDGNWNNKNGYDDKQDTELTNYYIKDLDQHKKAGIPVFNCEYAFEYAEDAYKKSRAKGYIPYVSRRSLSSLTTTLP